MCKQDELRVFAEIVKKFINIVQKVWCFYAKTIKSVRINVSMHCHSYDWQCNTFFVFLADADADADRV